MFSEVENMEEDEDDRNDTEITVDLLVDALERIEEIIHDTIKEINKNGR